MKKIFFLFVIYYSFLFYGQEKRNRNNLPPPPSKSLKEMPANYNVDDNLVYFKINKLSDSFDFAIFDNDKIPLEKIFIFSFIVEKNRNVSNIKIEKGESEKVKNELKRLIFLAKFPPIFIDNKENSCRFYRLKFIFDYKNKVLKTILL
jgi:hypothetical protein